jgi:ribose 5-phosphate isomerase A
MKIDELKRMAAEKAVQYVESEMVIGLGTGSTADHATHAIGQLVQAGSLHGVVGIPTSEATAREAREAGIPLTTLDQHPAIDLTIDGADEIDPGLNLIKGLGGALLREKIVAAASRRLIIVADHSKRVSRLGTKAPVPVEVIPFAQRPVTSFLESLGARVVRREADGQPFITDEGNMILDSYFAELADTDHLAQMIRYQPGVVEHGLFLGMAALAIIASPEGVHEMHRAPA